MRNRLRQSNPMVRIMLRHLLAFFCANAFCDLVMAMPSDLEHRQSAQHSPHFTTGNKLTSDQALRALVVNHSEIGLTDHTHSVYELFFKKNGVVFFRKLEDPNKKYNKTYRGKWWVKNHHIFSQWPTYGKHSGIYEMNYYHLLNNVYQPHYLHGTDSKKDSCLGEPFMVFKGDLFKLERHY